MKSKGQVNIATIAVIAVLLIGAYFVMSGGINFGGGTAVQLPPGVTGGEPIATYEVTFDADPIGNGAQDDVDDVNIEIYEWDETQNSILTTKNILDCSGATPAVWDGDGAMVEIESENYCKMNVYDALETWTAGDWEAEIADYLDLHVDDAGAKGADDSPAGGTANIKMYTSKTYLITLGESATTDDDDVIPVAFLLKSDGTTTLDREEIENGGIDVEVVIKYYSDAVANSKLTLSGECEDSDDYVTNLDSSWDGMISSSQTTKKSIDFTCTLEVKVNEKGYALITDNALGDAVSEQGYVVMTPYGENVTDGTWIEYGTSTLTGSVPYSAANVDTAQILFSESSVCGITITDASTTNAVADQGNENVAFNSLSSGCMDGTVKNGLEGLFDKDASTYMIVKVKSAPVDQDLAAAANDETISGAGGGTAESFFDIDCISPAGSTTDFCAQTLTG